MVLATTENFITIFTFSFFLAFREVFDLFDSNGGGSIDADELDEALRSADIQVTKDEINEVLSSMDKDGLHIFLPFQEPWENTLRDIFLQYIQKYLST